MLIFVMFLHVMFQAQIPGIMNEKDIIYGISFRKDSSQSMSNFFANILTNVFCFSSPPESRKSMQTSHEV